MNDRQRIWIVGANGRVGTEMKRLLDTRQVQVLNTDIEDVDITSAEDVAVFADMNRPHFIINCAGMTDVKRCEEDIESAFRINALGARNLSTAARKIGARIVQMSTDDVFSGERKEPYNEFDYAYPKMIYGKSKLAGENFVKELAPKHIIVRSSWVYGSTNTFLQQVLEQAEEKKSLSIAQDQFGCPTSAKLLAEKVIELMYEAEDGLYHVVCSGVCSRYEFAKEILRLTKKEISLKPVSSKEDSICALRPSYTILDPLMLRICGISLLPDWKSALEEYIEETYGEKKGR